MRRATLLVPLLLLPATPLAAQEWTAEQQQIVQWLETFTEEAYAAGDAETYVSWMDPDFTAWDYSTKAPMDLAGMKEAASHFFETYESASLKTKPVSVQVLGDVAVVHSWYKETMTEAGKETLLTGRWTVVLKKSGDDWRHLTWTWMQEKVAPEKMMKAKEAKEAKEAEEAEKAKEEQ